MGDSERSLADDPFRGYEKKYTTPIREKANKSTIISKNDKKGIWHPFSVFFLKAPVQER